VGQHAATEQHGDVLGVDRVVCGLATMDCFHRQGMAQDNRPPCWRTPIGEPVPGEEAGDGDDHSVPRGRDGLETRLRPGWHVPMEPALTVLVEDTGGHGPGMHVDATVTWVLLGVASPEVSSSGA
jgi:hypothetical protein